MRCLKSIAYILLYCFSILFVFKANSVNSSIFKIEKQLDDIEKNADTEDSCGNADEKSIEEDTLSDFDFLFRSTNVYDNLISTIHNLSKTEHFSNTQFSRLSAPVLGIFTPPPNF